MTPRVIHHASVFGTALSVDATGIGDHFSLSVPVVVDDDRGTFHALEHVLVTSAALVEQAASMHVENFSASTTPEAVTIAFSSACSTCFRTFAHRVVAAMLRSDFGPEDVHREVARPAASGEIAPGVIANEMTRTLWSEQRQLALIVRRCAFDGTSYAFNSGGHPNRILELRYDELRRAYKTWFVPMRARLLLIHEGDCAALIEMLGAALPSYPSRELLPAPQSHLPRDMQRRQAAVLHSQHKRKHLLFCSVWRFDDQTSLRDRVLLSLLFRYALTLPQDGLLAGVRTMPGFAGFEGFNGFERGMRQPLLVLTVAGDMDEEGLERALNAAITRCAAASLDRSFLDSVASAMLLECNEYPLSGEPAGAVLLQRLRQHLELGHPLQLFGDTGGCIADCAAQLVRPGEFGRLLGDLLLKTGNRSLIRLHSRPHDAPASLAVPTGPHHSRGDQSVAAAGSDLDCPECVRPRPVTVFRRIGTRMFAAAATNGIAYSFRISPAAMIEDDLVDFLPFYSRYVTEHQRPSREDGGGDLALPAHLFIHDNAFFRPERDRPDQCHVYRQMFGRCAEAELGLLDAYMDLQTKQLQRVQPSRVARTMQTFGNERRQALQRHGVAFAAGQAAKFHARHCLYRTRSTGLECLEWSQGQNLADRLVEDVLPRITRLWEKAPRADMVVTTDPEHVGATDGQEVPRLEMEEPALPSQRSLNCPRPIREFWCIPGGTSTVVVAWPVSRQCARMWLGLKAAESLLNGSELVRRLRAGGSYIPGVRFSVEDQSFQIHSGVTSRIADDLDWIVRFLPEWLESFRDEARFEQAVGASFRNDVALRRPHESALDDHLQRLFGITFPAVTQDAAPSLSLQEFKAMAAPMLAPGNGSVVVLSDTEDPRLIGSYGMQVRRI